jgi:hypothetical protein
MRLDGSQSPHPSAKSALGWGSLKLGDGNEGSENLGGRTRAHEEAPPTYSVILSGVVVREASDNVVEGSLASRFLKQARPDLLPRNDIGGVLLMPNDAVIKLRPLRIRQ